MKLSFFLFFISSFVFAQDIPYNQAQFKASHNSYAKEISIWDQLTVHNFRAIEFDLHTKKWLKGASDGDWYVYHHLFDRKSQIKYLSDGLDIIKKFNNQNSNHKVLTVFMDMGGFNKEHSEEDLNKILIKKLGNAIFSPSDLKASCPMAKSLVETIQKCGWPSLSALQGKIIFVLTSGDLNNYVKNSIAPMAFIASKPKNKINDSVFMNIAYNQNVEGLADLRNKNIITRFYFVDNKNEFKDSVEKLINFIAIDHVDSKKYHWQDTSK